MFRRYLLPVLATSFLVISLSMLASAQTGQLRGHVTMKQADGTVQPVAGALIDVYRVDIATKAPFSTKTDKKGGFAYAGLTYTGDYVIVASASGAQAYWQPGVKAGRDVDYSVEMLPGDGKRLTGDELKTLMASSGSASASSGGRETAEEKAKRAELMKKNAEIEEGNKKIEAANATIERAFRSGNEAMKAKNYDAAIAQYDEGLAADPEHPGAPALLTNKSMALNSRGVDKFNAAVRAGDEATKTAGIEAARKDWQAASEAGAKAVTMLKANPVPTDPTAAQSAKNNLYFALLARADSTRFFVAKVDPSKVDVGIAAYEEYIAAETDAVKKSKAEHDMAQMLFDANAYEKAKPAYEKILAGTPDDVDALKNLGFILFNLGAMKDAEGKKDEAKAIYVDAANNLQRFVDKSPDGPLKDDAQATLKFLKENQNVQAEKTTAPPRRRRP